MATATLAPPRATSFERHDVRLRFIHSLPPGAEVLDAGCGSCKTLRRLQDARPDLRFTGADVLDVSADCPPGAAFAQVDFENQPFPFADRQFDAIFFCHVMEHLGNRMNVLAEFARMLKPGGRIYIEGPGIRTLWLPSMPSLPSLQRGNAIGDDLNFFDNFTHVRPLSRRGLQMFLQMAGCACEESGVVRHWRKILASPFLLIGGLLARRRRWVCLAIWEICGWSIYATGRKLA
jgi:SAM-dependent methyltransferase